MTFIIELSTTLYTTIPVMGAKFRQMTSVSKLLFSDLKLEKDEVMGSPCAFRTDIDPFVSHEIK